VLGIAWFSGALSQALEILHHYWSLYRPHTVFVVGCFTAIKQRAWLGVSLLLCFLCVHHALYSAAFEAVMSCEKGFINHN
jgi:hypothetical protein